MTNEPAVTTTTSARGPRETLAPDLVIRAARPQAQPHHEMGLATETWSTLTLSGRTASAASLEGARPMLTDRSVRVTIARGGLLLVGGAAVEELFAEL